MVESEDAPAFALTMLDPLPAPQQDPAALPAALERAVKLAWVPPHFRIMFERLPDAIVLSGALPDDPGAVPLAVRQLLKVALLGSQLKLGALAVGGGVAAQVVATRGERHARFEGPGLGCDLRGMVERILGALYDAGDFCSLLETFAFGASNMATLQRITNHMLQSTDVDRALYAILCGITAGVGVGFNRAALFIHDPERDCFVGSKAVGPSDAEEAHRIWEDIEIHDKDIDAVLASIPAASFDSRFQRFVRGLTLAPSDLPGDEIAAAMAAGRPLLCHATPPRSEALARLGIADEAVLAVIRPHGKPLGLIVADNLYSRAPIAPDQLEFFNFFIDQTALVWENLQLLERVERLARIDGLTGLLNRREFETRFEEERSRVLRSNDTCALMLIDVDQFKLTNDQRGHEAGDEMLRQLGRLLRRALRGHDLAGRYGGDEFIVFLGGTSKDQLVATAGRVGNLACADGISLSIGGAVWPGDCDDPARLKSVADGNLYRAKRAGRCRACFDGMNPCDFTPDVAAAMGGSPTDS